MQNVKFNHKHFFTFCQTKENVQTNENNTVVKIHYC